MADNAREGAHSQHPNGVEATSVPIGTSIEGDTLDFALGIPLIVDREVGTERKEK
jgi:hypothetical protein